jgi:hypothetical protein
VKTDPVVLAVQTWLEKVVIALNLCPFAKRELKKDRIRFVHCKAQTHLGLLTALNEEFDHLNEHPEVETTLLIHPVVLQNFYNFNAFLDVADNLLKARALEGTYQIASFHPHYQFAGTLPDDPENYTNRAPFPVLHILREAGLEAAIANHPDPDNIPTRNIALMNSMGLDALEALIATCRAKGPHRYKTT